LIDGQSMHPLFAALEKEVMSATSGMEDPAFSIHPPGKWCTAEILEHLTLAFSGTVKGCKRCIEAGHPLAGKPSLKQRAIVFWVLDCGMYPEGIQAPKSVVPKGDVKGNAALDGILKTIHEMDASMQSCEEIYGSSGKLMDHPVLGPLGTKHWRKFHLIHTQHHMKQVSALRAH